MDRLQIEKRLIGNGHLILENRRHTRSLSRADRSIIHRVRGQALAAGISLLSINDLEMEGERGVRGLIAPAVEAEFRYLQEFKWLAPFRMYDIQGDHPQNNSTVGVMTLIHEGILPRDIGLFHLAFQYLNELSFLGYCDLTNIFWRIRKFFK